ncbi:MAG: citryl-CoA lyase [Chloroflexi bacterium]|nr:MAG: citryl-CoA lyase [Chloroflexota bacterium]
MGSSTADRIVVRGFDLSQDLIGNVSLGAMAFLELKGRLPADRELAVFDAILVTLVEHGMTPSAIATRMTYLGAPESVQAAVAAGLLGLGGRFGGTVEDAARMLQVGGSAAEIVSDYRARKQQIPGLGHPIHKPIDPRVPRLYEVAAANGFSGRYVRLMDEIAEQAKQALGKALPVNATGAIGALASELEIPWQVTRGLAVIARAIGLVGHLQEEMREPLATEIWERVDAEASGGAGPAPTE